MRARVDPNHIPEKCVVLLFHGLDYPFSKPLRLNPQHSWSVNTSVPVTYDEQTLQNIIVFFISSYEILYLKNFQNTTVDI